MYVAVIVAGVVLFELTFAICLGKFLKGRSADDEPDA